MKKLILENPTPETKKRIIQVLERIRKGQPKSKIVKWLKDEYDIYDQQAYKYIHDAYYYIENSNNIEDVDIQATKASQIERIESILENAIDKNDTKSALKALDMLNKINQLYVEKQEVDLKIKDMVFKFGDE